MKRTRVVVGAVAFVLLGLGAMGVMLHLMTRETGCSMSSTDFFNAVTLSMEAAVVTASALESASDVVVRREPSGSLTVYGRAVGHRRSLASIDELPAFLQTLPSPGAGLVLVASSGTVLEGPRSHPRDAELRATERAIAAILQRAGFSEPRGSVRTFLPLACRETAVRQ